MLAQSSAAAAQHSYKLAADTLHPAKGSWEGQAIEYRVFELINDERTKNGRKPLRWTDHAASVARFHSVNMATLDFFSHSDLSGKRPSNRADMLGLRDWQQIGENIAWLRGYHDAATQVVEQWMRSPGHRSNVMNKNFSDTGVGLSTTADGKTYFTQIFLKCK